MKRYRIKEVARRMGLSIRTIKEYSRKGLISSKRGRLNGHRFFSERDIRKFEKWYFGGEK